MSNKDDIFVEPHHEKTCLQGFRPDLTQTRLYCHRLEISDLESRGILQSV